MNSPIIYVIVEGQTEQTFVRDVLAPKMSYKGIYLNPSLIGKPGQKGGNVRFERAMTDIRNFLKQRNDTFITTMFDYYKINSDWPGKAELDRKIRSGATLTANEKANILETATLKEIARKFPELIQIIALSHISKCMNSKRYFSVMLIYWQRRLIFKLHRLRE